MGSQSKPNIIFVFADQLRASSLGYAGEEEVITPNFDRFARKNAYFETAVSIFPVCTPYRGSLLTGRAPTSTGLVLNDLALSTSETSIAHAAKTAGYDTAYIGKWHLDGPDRKAWVPPGSRRQGFDYWAAANFDHNYGSSIYYEDTDEPKVWEGFDAEAYPETARSVVNYGIPNLAGQALASRDTFDIERAVREAILNFEPRILPDSLDVQVRADFSALNRNRLVIELHGQVWGIPVPLEFFLWTELDVETGEVHVSPDRRA